MIITFLNALLPSPSKAQYSALCRPISCHNCISYATISIAGTSNLIRSSHRNRQRTSRAQGSQIASLEGKCLFWRVLCPSVAQPRRGQKSINLLISGFSARSEKCTQQECKHISVIARAFCERLSLWTPQKSSLRVETVNALISLKANGTIRVKRSCEHCATGSFMSMPKRNARYRT